MKKRKALEFDAYREIYRHADPTIRRAMELAVNIIQRRTDLQRLRFDDCHRDGYMYLIQSKTHKHGKAAYLRIQMDLPVAHSETGARTLQDLIQRCRDTINCPYVLHERPSRIVASKERDHWAQLPRRRLTDGFNAARNASGLFDGYKAGTIPTFHEILGLGEYLRREQGWDVKQIQTLRGHTSERTTKLYLMGHEWTTVGIPSVS